MFGRSGALYTSIHTLANIASPFIW